MEYLLKFIEIIFSLFEKLFNFLWFEMIFTIKWILFVCSSAAVIFLFIYFYNKFFKS